MLNRLLFVQSSTAFASKLKTLGYILNKDDMSSSSSDVSTVASSVQESELSPRSKDQEPQRPRFRFFAYILGALRNLGKSLNPTVDFRKRNLPEDAFSTKHSTESRRKISENPEVLKRSYTHTKSGRLVPRTTRTTSGHKTYYLVKAFFPLGTKA